MRWRIKRSLIFIYTREYKLVTYIEIYIFVLLEILKHDVPPSFRRYTYRHTYLSTIIFEYRAKQLSYRKSYYKDHTRDDYPDIELIVISK